MVPLLRGGDGHGTDSKWDNDVYAEYSTRHQSHTHMRMIRTPDWKLICDFLDRNRDELYDLKNDPAETTNLIKSQDPEVVAVIPDLQAKILQKMKQNRDPVLAQVAP